MATKVNDPNNELKVPAGTQAGATAGNTYQTPQQAANAKAEERLEERGHLPGLSEVQKDEEKNMREAGQEDAAGNKIHHKGFLKKMFHWEHNGMNAD
ncbi:MAG: hypothetical protein Q9174_004594 [Haloplaca sp. 1 TL-2023]